MSGTGPSTDRKGIHAGGRSCWGSGQPESRSKKPTPAPQGPREDPQHSFHSSRRPSAHRVSLRMGGESLSREGPTSKPLPQATGWPTHPARERQGHPRSRPGGQGHPSTQMQIQRAGPPAPARSSYISSALQGQGKFPGGEETGWEVRTQAILSLCRCWAAPTPISSLSTPDRPCEHPSFPVDKPPRK